MKRLAIIAIILLAAWFCIPAHAQFNGCTSFCGKSSSAVVDGPGFNNNQASGGAPAFSLTFESSISSSATTATVDYGTLTYGSGNTRVIVAVAWRATAGSITGVTIGGTALTHVTGAQASQNLDFTDVWESSAALAGSSGDVQVTYGTAPAAPNSVALYNLVTTTPAASSAVPGGVLNNTTASVTITVPTGGGAIVASMFESGNFTTGSNFTVDSNLGPNRTIFGHTTTTGSVTVTLNASPSDTYAISTVSWGP